MSRRPKTPGLWGHAINNRSEAGEKRKGKGFSRELEGSSLYDQMVLEERRAAARASGLSVADIEERANLESAIALSTENGPVKTPKVAQASKCVNDMDEGESEGCQLWALMDDVEEVEEAATNAWSTKRDDDESNGRKLERDLGRFARVPEEVALRMLAMLTPEAAARTAATSQDWARLAMSESLCEVLCRRCFHGRRSINFKPARWHGWRGMIARRSRPRVGGLYALRTSKWRHVRQEDMFLPADLKGIFHVEVVWWRLLRFYEDGRVAYALVNEAADLDPIETAVHLLDNPDQSFVSVRSTRRVKQHEQTRAYIGKYTVHQRKLDVAVSLPHARMRFSFLFENAQRGHFIRLRLVQHTQYDQSGRFPIQHNLPDPCTFHFNTVAAWS